MSTDHLARIERATCAATGTANDLPDALLDAEAFPARSAPAVLETLDILVPGRGPARARRVRRTPTRPEPGRLDGNGRRRPDHLRQRPGDHRPRRRTPWLAQTSHHAVTLLTAALGRRPT
ncbi:hypothetical protein PUR61_00390 [Streptomyces sp. BE20]|uniref:hypothetical protein n=1 Tax=Streptomyces sp. BE20 TaxID=3002525 RepID=UPI002E781991|nr:hypothetical protein [Streptomyces sp. BE20]MEE1820674.1 hypothetical protein [Streptomyces sp. BE20]